MRSTIYNLSSKINYLLLICVVSTLPFSIEHLQLNSFFILLLLANSIPLIILSAKQTGGKNYLGVLFFLAPYLILLTGLVRTDNSHSASFELQKKIALVFFPVILGFTPKISTREIRTVLLSFVLSCLTVGIFSLAGAAYKYFQSGNTAFFFYHDLSGIAGMHASYLSLHIILAVAIILLEFLNGGANVLLKLKVFWIIVLLFFSVMIFLLSARMQMALFMLGLSIYIVYFFIKNKKIKKIFFVLTSTLTIFLLFIFLIPVNRERFKEAINYKGRYSIDKQWGGRALRELNWDCSLKIIDNNLFFGVGTGDAQDELQKCYVENKYGALTFWKNTKYNAHNQFLETAIGQGLIGLLMLAGILIASCIHAVKQKKIVYFVFLLIFILSCLTESMFERQHGLVFFAFFNAFFAFQYRAGKE